MASSDIRKRTIYFLATAVLIVLVLLLFPLTDTWVIAALAEKFGITIAADGTISGAESSQAAKMAETTVTLTVTILHLLKIIVWMALVIALVRYVSFLITKTVYRNAKQGEISSLLRTVRRSACLRRCTAKD